MTNILAIETATAACSVALRSRAGVLERQQVGNNIHSQVLLPMVKEVLAEAGMSVQELDAVAVGQGPGSFTGLRIGVGVAQGLAYGAHCVMVGVSSLAALALQAARIQNAEGSVLSGIDARMQEIYLAEYRIRSGLPELQGEIQVLAPEAIILSNDDVVLAGNAWHEYARRLDAVLARRSLPAEGCRLPAASAVLELAERKYARREYLEPQYFQPEYIRDDVAKKKVVSPVSRR